MQNYNSKFKIFIAHPDEKLVGMLKPKFKEHFLVDSAHDGVAALRKIKIHLPHIILSSEGLPLLSGIGLLKFVRSHSELHSRPFIFLGTVVDLPSALSLSANDWIADYGSSDKVIEKVFYHIKINNFIYV